MFWTVGLQMLLFTPQRTFLLLISVKRLSGPEGRSVVGGIRSIDKLNDLIGNLTCNLLAWSVVHHPTTLPHARLTFFVLLIIRGGF